MNDHANDEQARQKEVADGEATTGAEKPEGVVKWIIIPLLVLFMVIPKILFNSLTAKIKMFREFREWQRNRAGATGKMLLTPKLLPLFLCKNRCGWKGSTEPMEVCPNCGVGTYHTASSVTGCSIFYRLGRDLRIRNTGVSMMRGQEAHVEAADIIDLLLFIAAEFPQQLGDRQAFIRYLESVPRLHHPAFQYEESGLSAFGDKFIIRL